jgi:hypothetical protein
MQLAKAQINTDTDGALGSNVDIQITDWQNVDQMTESVDYIWTLLTAP